MSPKTSSIGLTTAFTLAMGVLFAQVPTQQGLPGGFGGGAAPGGFGGFGGMPGQGQFGGFGGDRKSVV